MASSTNHLIGLGLSMYGVADHDLEFLPDSCAEAVHSFPDSKLVWPDLFMITSTTIPNPPHLREMSRVKHKAQDGMSVSDRR